MNRDFPHQIQDLPPNVNENVAKLFSDDLKGFVTVGPGKYLFFDCYRKEAQRFYNFGVRPDDVWIVGVPRSGTTMLEELSWLLVNGLDYEKARSVKPTNRIAILGISLWIDPFSECFTYEQKKWLEMMKEQDDFLEASAKSSGRRVIKTHLPFSLLPPEILTSGCKIIYAARNPKDVIVSWFHMQACAGLRKYQGDFRTYLKLFLDDLIIFNPYWSHIEEGWELRDHPNVKFLFYENTTASLRGSIEDIAAFLGKELTSEQLDGLTEFMGFGEFKKFRSGHNNVHIQKNPSTSEVIETDFVRRGKIGGWRDYITGDLAEEVNRWMEQNTKRIGIEYPVS